MPPRRADAAVPTKGDRREQALLAAAERLLADGRFAAASVAGLAAEAGLSRASFYFYFASKQDLLAAAVEAVVAGLESRLVEQFGVADAGEVSDVVAGTVRAAADVWWEHRVVLVASVELGSALPEVYARNRASIGQVSRLTSELMAQGGHAGDDPSSTERTVTALVMMTERNFYDLARGKHPRWAYDELADVLVTIWLRALALQR